MSHWHYLCFFKEYKKKPLGEHMDFLEWLYYESLPYVYAGFSVYAFMNADASKLVGIAGVVLAFCSYVVLSKRYNYRVFQSRYNHKMRI